MRTTLTLEPDVAAKLRSRARKTGRPFKDVVNDALRLGLQSDAGRGRRTAFAVKTRDLGRLAPGLNVDNVGDLLERLEGPLHR
ncbi:MAG TPA: hypothetical protein VMM93_12290 [Vicinamibacterales bacterium]|nr:hypothetical protein [Vicinamibacterales bacterium]